MADLTFGQTLGLTGAQGLIGLGSTFLQNHYNKQMAQYQNDFNLEMWNRQNEYNSPKQTMNRLVEAGINPRAYQQIGQFANGGAPQPAAQMSKTSELAAFQSVARQGLENQLLNERLKQTRMDTQLKKFMSSKAFNQSEYEQLKYILLALTNGLDPQQMNPGMVTSFVDDGDSLTPAYMKSTLMDFIKTGETENPFLKQRMLANLLDSAGLDLRKVEKALKSIEQEDYEKHGIRGSSDYINLFRFLKSLFEL